MIRITFVEGNTVEILPIEGEYLSYSVDGIFKAYSNPMNIRKKGRVIRMFPLRNILEIDLSDLEQPESY